MRPTSQNAIGYGERPAPCRSLWPFAGGTGTTRGPGRLTPDTLRSAARARTAGSLADVFDRATCRPIDLNAPLVSIDISADRAAGDKLMTAAMLCTWSYGVGCVDAAAALADLGSAARRSYLGVMDELWRALRGAAGLVEHADALTRLNRARAWPAS